MRKKLFSVIQILIAVALLAFVFTTLDDKSALWDAARSAAAGWPFILAGLGCFFICLAICIFRWNILLRAQGIRLPFWRVSCIFYIGHFFNIVLPGSTGGDVIKSCYIVGEAPDKKTEAVATVFIDRIVGLVALVLFSITIMLARLPFFLRYTETKLALAFNSALLIGSVAGSFLVFRQNLFEKWTVFRKLESRTALGAVLARFYNAFHLCFRKPAVLAQTFVLSILNHFVLILMEFALGRGLGIQLPFTDFLSVFPIINAVAAIPVTPGGLGTREATTKFLLGVFGVDGASAVTLSLLVYGAFFLWSIIGGLVYVLYLVKRGRPQASPETLTTGAAR
jgi:uncharacterized protein (TIRG00374 family)